MCAFLLQGYFFGLKMRSVNDTVVCTASPPRFLLFPDNSNAYSIIVNMNSFNMLITSR